MHKAHQPYVLNLLHYFQSAAIILLYVCLVSYLALFQVTFIYLIKLFYTYAVQQDTQCGLNE